MNTALTLQLILSGHDLEGVTCFMYNDASTSNTRCILTFLD